MNHRELAVLDAVNIASTIHQRDRRYQATAAQITEVLNNDPRIQGDAFAVSLVQLTSLEVGATLRAMAKNWPDRWAPLVERLNTRQWALTSAGVKVLSA